MKIVIRHDFPRRLRYAEVYMQFANASAYLKINGSRACCFATIGNTPTEEFSDREYSRLRSSIPVQEVLDDNGEFFVVRNAKGFEERWMKPRWILSGIRRIRKHLKTHTC